MFAELELLNLKHDFPARPTFDLRNCLSRAKLNPIHIPQIEDIYIDLYHKQPKGKGKGKEGESSSTQEEAPEIPPSAAPEQVVTLASPEKETAEDVPMGPSTQDVATAVTTNVPSVPPTSSSIFSSLVDMSPSISSLISELPSLPMSSSPAVSLPPMSTSSASLLMPPPSVSTFFPSTTAAAPFSVSGPSPISPAWISQHLSQQKRKVPVALMDFSMIPSKGVKKQKPITRFSQSASGERVMEITYPNPLKDKKDLSSEDYTVTQVTMGTSSENIQGEALSIVDALCKKLQEAKEEKRLLKEKNKHLLQALHKMGSAPPTTAAETPEPLSQDKIDEYGKI
ncbi:hypothetical protein KI387_008859, partial [Taxus chinensis]